MNEQPTRMRASDTERERVAEALRHAMGEGRLTLAEGEQRLAAAYAATYRDELPPITADLPPDEPAPGPAERTRTGRPSSRRRRPAIRLVALAALILGIWALAAGGPVWPAIVLGVLAVTLAKHSRLDHHRRDHAQDNAQDNARDHAREHGGNGPRVGPYAHCRRS